jgi:hypothetical protein
MKRLRWATTLAVLVVGCVIAESIAHRRVVPPVDVKSLDGFLRWRPSAEQFAMVNVGGREHLIAYGPTSSVLWLSSGPSAYVFDASGRLVDWSADIGDDPRFDARWQAQRSRGAGRTIHRDDAANWPASRPAH